MLSGLVLIYVNTFSTNSFGGKSTLTLWMPSNMIQGKPLTKVAPSSGHSRSEWLKPNCQKDVQITDAEGLIAHRLLTPMIVPFVPPSLTTGFW